MDSNLRKASEELLVRIKEDYSKADPDYFERMKDLFFMILEAAQRQGVAAAALNEMMRYNYERELVVADHVRRQRACKICSKTELKTVRLQ